MPPIDLHYVPTLVVPAQWPRPTCDVVDGLSFKQLLFRYIVAPRRYVCFPPEQPDTLQCLKFSLVKHVLAQRTTLDLLLGDGGRSPFEVTLLVSPALGLTTTSHIDTRLGPSDTVPLRALRYLLSAILGHVVTKLRFIPLTLPRCVSRNVPLMLLDPRI